MSAGITYNQVSSAIVNPTQYYIPVNVSDEFNNSNLLYDGTALSLIDNFANQIIYINTFANTANYGSLSAGLSSIYMDVSGGYISISSMGQLRINAPTDASPSHGTATHLPINVNGTNYKIQLLNL